MFKAILNSIKKITSSLRVIDYLFLLMLTLLAGYFIYRFSRKSATIYVDMIYKYEGYGANDIPPKYWKVMKIQEGDVGYNSFGQDVAKVLDVEQSYWGNGRRNYTRLAVELDAIFNTASKNYIYQGNPLLIGNDLELSFGQSQFVGTITNIYQSKQERFAGWDKAEAVIKLTAKDVKPWLAQELIDFKINSSDFPLETLQAKVKPAQKVIKTADGQLVKALAPINKDVAMTLKLGNVLCKNEVCFYRYEVPLAVGSDFYADSGSSFLPASSVEEIKIEYLE
jgi:hypothetical protein